MMYTKKYNHYGLMLILLCGLSACTVPKRVIYFSDLPQDSLQIAQMVPTFEEPVIQPDDILSITIQTIDPSGTAAINQAPSIPVAGSQQISGFLVDKNGNISVPMLGTIEVAGLTTREARELIAKKAAVHYRDPNVQVRFANYRITVLGEVGRPATYTLPSEKVSILDAIGMAGDLTIFGKRENVLVIRDNGGEKEFARLNLNSTELFQSPYYYLRQNDVIYVEPGKGRIVAGDSPRWQALTITLSTISIISVLLTRFL